MNKLLPIFCGAFLLFMPAFGQKKTQEAIYLKNGSVLRNVQDMQHADSLIRVTTAEGSVIVFKPGDILRMTHEPRKHAYRESGYLLQVEWGVLSGRGAAQQTWWGWGGNSTSRDAYTSFSAAIVNGYRFNRYAGVGIGVGLDAYAGTAITPLFARFTGQALPGRISPIYLVDAGYGFYSPIFNDKNEFNTGSGTRYYRRGGLMLQPALGIKAMLGRDASFYLTSGYRLQNAYLETSSDRQESSVTQQMLFRRLSLRMGFSF